MDERGLAETHRRQPWNWAVRVSRERGEQERIGILPKEDMNKKKKRREKADDKRRGWPLGRSPGARGMILWTFVAVLQCTVKGIHSILRFSTHWGPLVTANQSVDAGGAAIRWLEVGR